MTQFDCIIIPNDIQKYKTTFIYVFNAIKSINVHIFILLVVVDKSLNVTLFSKAGYWCIMYIVYVLCISLSQSLLQNEHSLKQKVYRCMPFLPTVFHLSHLAPTACIFRLMAGARNVNSEYHRTLRPYNTFYHTISIK